MYFGLLEKYILKLDLNAHKKLMNISRIDNSIKRNNFYIIKYQLDRY